MAVIGYLSDDSDPKTINSSILHFQDGLIMLGFQTSESKVNSRKMKDEDWIGECEKSFKPIFVTDDIVILPSWEKALFPDKIVIRIKPGMAFGTGAHSTTLLCMRAIRRFLKPKDRVVDVGCGSGILSILSAKLGASFVLGLDIDQDSIENAHENLALNQTEDSIEIKQGTVSADIPKELFDLAVANLNKREIFESLENIKILVKDEGLFIFSGILNDEETEVRNFFKKKNLKIVEIQHQDSWVCFVCKK